MADRRTPSRRPGPADGPRKRTGPGRAGAPARPPRADSRPAPASVVSAERRPRRLTGRAAVLVLVVAVLTLSYASSMRAYLQQRSQIDTLRSQIALREVSITALESEQRRWSDPAYLKEQARARLGYVMPGEKSYLVLDEHGNPIATDSSLSPPGQVIHATPTPWWSDEWASVELAGHPPKATAPPVTRIDGVHQRSGG